MKRELVAGAFVTLACILAWACSDGVLVMCHDIPEGGCPVQGGVECQDPTCAAGYTCNPYDGGWTLAHTCAGFDASPDDASVDSQPPPNDAGYDIDAPPGAFGGPGCGALEMPDCPLGQALLCQNGCCGCEDLWVCDDGGWDPWGTCSDDAGLAPL